MPDNKAFDRMLKAGLNPTLWVQYHKASGSVAGIIFANVFADINGDYDFAQINALNKRMANDLHLMKLQCDGKVTWRASQTKGREVAIVEGGKPAPVSKLSSADGAA